MTVARNAPEQAGEIEVVSQTMVKLIKQSGVYAVGDILPKIIPLVMIPILTRYLSVAEFGITDLIATMVALLSPFMLMGIDTGIQAYYFDGRNQEEKKQLISSGYWLLFIWCLVCCAILFPFSNFLAGILLGETTYMRLVEMALLSIPFRLLIEIAKFIMRIEERTWGYVFITLMSSFVVACISMLGLYWKQGLDGYYFGMLISYSLVFLMTVPLVRRWLILSISKTEIHKILSIGLPMLPAIFMSLCMNYISRYFLLTFRSVEEVGYYQLGWKIATIVGFILPLINQAWMPMRFKLFYTNPDYRIVYRKMLDYLVGLTTIGGLLITMFSSWLIGVFAPDNYQVASITIVPFCIMTVAQSMNLVVYSGPALVKKPRFYWITILMVIMGVLFQYFFTPHYGIAGAAWATALTYCCMAAVYMFLMDAVLHVCNFDWIHNLSFVVISWLAIFSMGFLNQFQLFSAMILKIGIFISYGFVLAAFHVLGRSEWGFLLRLFKKENG
jgi:O-antigen/teichoic acid export membrane protein